MPLPVVVVVDGVPPVVFVVLPPVLPLSLLNEELERASSDAGDFKSERCSDETRWPLNKRRRALRDCMVWNGIIDE